MHKTIAENVFISISARVQTDCSKSMASYKQ